MSSLPSETVGDEDRKSDDLLGSAITPHDWMDEARALRAAVIWESNSSVQVIALALRRVHDDAVKTCADIASSHAERVRQHRIQKHSSTFKRMSPEAQDEVRSEERGESIASAEIAKAISALSQGSVAAGPTSHTEEVNT